MKLTTKDIANIAIGVAAMVAGGWAIFLASHMIPMPGMKYVMMSPYLSLVVYVIHKRTRYPLTTLFVGGTFALIMVFVNVFMGMAIGITAVLGQVAASLNKKRGGSSAAAGAIAFAALASPVALIISKGLIGGVFSDIPNLWIAATLLLSTPLGALGVYAGKKMMGYLRLS